MRKNEYTYERSLDRETWEQRSGRQTFRTGSDPMWQVNGRDR